MPTTHSKDAQLLEEVQALHRRNEELEKADAEKNKALEALRETEQRYRLLVENIGDVIWIRDMSLRFTYLSPSVSKMTGYRPEEAMALPLEKAYTPESLEQAIKIFQEELALEAAQTHDFARTRKMELEGLGKDGSRIWTESIMTFIRDPQGLPVGILGISRDITERKQHEEAIRQLAFYDTLTGLPNRRLLYDRFSQAREQAQRNQKGLGLLLLDLDRFKEVNDTFGHPLGDRLLKSVALRLMSLLRGIDTIARLGGDEFLVLIPELGGLEDVATVAQKILGAFESPFPVEEQMISITGSLGVAMFPQDGQEIDELMKKADTAMYRAKDKGRDNYQFYNL
jgi:diguanylate cyclase (GGDEF)-like protein/PAS domain S-box-containing protein